MGMPWPLLARAACDEISHPQHNLHLSCVNETKMTALVRDLFDEHSTSLHFFFCSLPVPARSIRDLHGGVHGAECSWHGSRQETHCEIGRPGFFQKLNARRCRQSPVLQPLVNPTQPAQVASPNQASSKKRKRPWKDSPLVGVLGTYIHFVRGC